MSDQKRRTEIATGTPNIGNSFTDIEFDHGTAVNIHGLRVEFIGEPQDADANAHGVIGVYVLPAGVIQNSDLPVALGTFGNEDFAPYLWGIGLWAATNQTPAKWVFAPSTSRTLQRGGRVVVDLRIEGMSAGLLRQATLITCFTSVPK